jgi:hypothetical protein
MFTDATPKNYKRTKGAHTLSLADVGMYMDCLVSGFKLAHVVTSFHLATSALTSAV